MGNNLPAPVYAADAVLLDNKIYLAGGSNNSSDNISTFYVYDLLTENWIQKASLLTKGHGLALEILDYKLWAIGGFYDKKRVEIYEPSTDSWSTSYNLPQDRWWHRSWNYAENIYVIGGYSGFDNAGAGIKTNSVFVTSKNSNSWSLVSNFPHNIANSNAVVLDHGFMLKIQINYTFLIWASTTFTARTAMHPRVRLSYKRK